MALCRLSFFSNSSPSSCSDKTEGENRLIWMSFIILLPFRDNKRLLYHSSCVQEWETWFLEKWNWHSCCRNSTHSLHSLPVQFWLLKLHSCQQRIEWRLAFSDQLHLVEHSFLFGLHRALRSLLVDFLFILYQIIHFLNIIPSTIWWFFFRIRQSSNKFKNDMERVGLGLRRSKFNTEMMVSSIYTFYYRDWSTLYRELS